MTNDRPGANHDWMQFQVQTTLNDLCSGAESVRVIGSALERSAVELLADTPPDMLRELAAIVKTHVIGLLLSASTLAAKAARLEAIADMADMADSSDLPADRDG